MSFANSKFVYPGHGIVNYEGDVEKEFGGSRLKFKHFRSLSTEKLDFYIPCTGLNLNLRGLVNAKRAREAVIELKAIAKPISGVAKSWHTRMRDFDVLLNSGSFDDLLHLFKCLKQEFKKTGGIPQEHRMYEVAKVWLISELAFVLQQDYVLLEKELGRVF